MNYNEDIKVIEEIKKYSKKEQFITDFLVILIIWIICSFAAIFSIKNIESVGILSFAMLIGLIFICLNEDIFENPVFKNFYNIDDAIKAKQNRYFYKLIRKISDEETEIDIDHKTFFICPDKDGNKWLVEKILDYEYQEPNMVSVNSLLV